MVSIHGYRIDPSIVDVNSIDPKQLARIRQQRLQEQKRRELERYFHLFRLIEHRHIDRNLLDIFEH